jgi:hypothetical protein
MLLFFTVTIFIIFKFHSWMTVLFNMYTQSRRFFHHHQEPISMCFMKVMDTLSLLSIHSALLPVLSPLHLLVPSWIKLVGKKQPCSTASSK